MLKCSPRGCRWLLYSGLRPSFGDSRAVWGCTRSLTTSLLPFAACCHTCCSSSGSFVLLDGDKIAALAAVYLRQLLSHAPPGTSDSIQMGVVQTAYANGASTRFLTEQLGLQVACTNTGETQPRLGDLLGSVTGPIVPLAITNSKAGCRLGGPAHHPALEAGSLGS